ncbi:MAG: hypothetical protein NVS1B10_08180 [Candidatus Saccharimonadales bacterium]
MKKTHSVGAILLNPKGKIAIVNNRGSSWTFPKGHMEANETPLETLRREVFEETGVDKFISIKDLGTYERPRIGLNSPEDFSEIKAITLYLCLTDTETLQPLDPDNPEARWVDPEDIESILTHKKDIEFYNSVKSEVVGIARMERSSLVQALHEMEKNQKLAEQNPTKQAEFEAEFTYSNPNNYEEMVKLYNDFGYSYSRGLWELAQLRYALALEDEQKRLSQDS